MTLGSAFYFGLRLGTHHPCPTLYYIHFIAHESYPGAHLTAPNLAIKCFISGEARCWETRNRMETKIVFLIEARDCSEGRKERVCMGRKEGM